MSEAAPTESRAKAIRAQLTPERVAALKALETAGDRGLVSSARCFLPGLGTLGWAERLTTADQLGDRAWVLTDAGRAALAIASAGKR
jgi:hypothetical protein